MQEAKYSANFRKYLGETDFQFTVRGEETADQHLDSVIQYAEACGVKGFRDKPGVAGQAGLAENEDSWPVTHYIVGTYFNKKKQESEWVVWLYTATGDYKHCTIYTNQWNELWFIPDTSNVFRGDPPTRATAAANGLLIEVPERNVIRTSYPATDGSGKTWHKYARVAPPSTNGQAATTQASVQKAPQQPKDDPDQLAERFVGAVQTGCNTVDHLVNFGKTALHRKQDFGSAWTRVNQVLRSKAVMLAQSHSSTAMIAAVDQIRDAFGPFYDSLRASFVPQQSQNEFVMDQDPFSGVFDSKA